MNNIALYPFCKMLSKSLEKYINSLKEKKSRESEQAYVVEGEKITAELLKSTHEVKRILCTQEWYDAHNIQLKHYLPVVTILKKFELEKLSAHKSAPEVICVVKMHRPSINIDRTKLMLVLDGIQDPGNMGTILRSCDWFGIHTVFVSETCVDIYNPKVVQAAMGSLFRVHVMETSLSDFFAKNNTIPVFAADMLGESVYTCKKTLPAFLLIGSEGKGIQKALEKHITKTISIPGRGGAESLNAAVAASIIISHWMTS